MISVLTFLASCWCALLAVSAPGPAHDTAQMARPDLNRIVETQGTGTLVFRYPTRDDVRGHSHGVEIILGEGRQRCLFNGHFEGDQAMVRGPAVALATVRGGQIVALEITIGAPRQTRRPDLDLGTLHPGWVAAFFLEQVPRMSDDTAGDAMLGAVIAREAEVAAPLLAVVRDPSHGTDKRQSALFWAAVLASEKALETLRDVILGEDEDMELRESAVFALSRMDRPDTLPLLMKIARDDDVPQLQQAAFFALAEHNTPEVVALFEEILLED